MIPSIKDTESNTKLLSSKVEFEIAPAPDVPPSFKSDAEIKRALTSYLKDHEEDDDEDLHDDDDEDDEDY